MTATTILPDPLGDARQGATIPPAALAQIEKLTILAALPGTAYLTSQEAALYIGTKPEVLRTWRSTGKGPRFRGRGPPLPYARCQAIARS
jgi:hypothetical protein